jgi:putative tricarboxylic transport membrane protein
MILAQIAFFIAGMLGGQIFARLTKVSPAYLIPMTLVFAFVGALAIRGAFVDLWFVVIFGILGYGLKKANWPIGCYILGRLLGPMIEQNYFRALIISNGSFKIFFSSPLSLILLACILLILVLNFLPKKGRITENLRQDRSN